MNSERRKQLQQEYKQMRTEMGVFQFRCNALNKVYLGADQNLKATINGIAFQLKSGSYLTNRVLQKDWKEYGADGFTIETLEILQYDKEDADGDKPPRSDYSADLQILKDSWRERLTGEGFEVADINTKFKKGL